MFSRYDCNLQNYEIQTLNYDYYIKSGTKVKVKVNVKVEKFILFIIIKAKMAVKARMFSLLFVKD